MRVVSATLARTGRYRHGGLHHRMRNLPWPEARRRVAVPLVAAQRVTGDCDDRYACRGREMHGAAVVSHVQRAAAQHGARLPQRRAPNRIDDAATELAYQRL